MDVGGMAAEPPAGVGAGVGKDGAGAGLAGRTLRIGLEAAVLKRSEHELGDLHGIVTAAVTDTDAPDGPVAGPEEEGSGEEREEGVGGEFLPVVQQLPGGIVEDSAFGKLGLSAPAGFVGHNPPWLRQIRATPSLRSD